MESLPSGARHTWVVRQGQRKVSSVFKCQDCTLKHLPKESVCPAAPHLTLPSIGRLEEQGHGLCPVLGGQGGQSTEADLSTKSSRTPDCLAQMQGWPPSEMVAPWVSESLHQQREEKKTTSNHSSKDNHPCPYGSLCPEPRVYP